MLQILKNKFINFLHQADYKSLRISIIEKAENLTETEKKKLKNLIYKGNSVIGYVPYAKGQTELLFYNFFSINYGIRSSSTVIISYTDENFKSIKSKAFKTNFRESIYHQVKQLENVKTPIFCTVLVINEKIRNNHGGHGGHLRFWGSWNNFSAFSHSMPVPPVNDLLKLIKLRNFFFKKKDYKNIWDRRLYPKESTVAGHFATTIGYSEISDRGDLSPALNRNVGFSVIGYKNKEISGCYHDSPFTRNNIEKNTKTELIVTLPKINSLDAILYFGECCKTGTEFSVKLFNSNNQFKPVAEKEITIENQEPIRVSSIFQNDESIGKISSWINFKPISGSSRDYYINIIYANRENSKVFDGVHSQSFTNKIIGRALKFAPFKIHHPYNSEIVLFGHEEKDVKYRIRIISTSETNFEIINSGSVKAKTIKFINLKDEMIKEPSIKSDYFIAQLESEEQNLKATSYTWNISNDQQLKSVCVDHLTGG